MERDLANDTIPLNNLSPRVLGALESLLEKVKTHNMKITTTLLIATASGLAMSSSLQAALLVHESFSYANGSDLATQAGGTGFNTAWIANSTTVPGPPPVTTPDFTAGPGLSYSGLASSGGSATVVGNGAWQSSARREFPTIDTTTGVIWGSYLVRPDVIGDDGFEIKYGEGLPVPNINWGIATGFGDGGGTATRLNTNSNDVQVYGPALVLGQTHLIVWAFNGGPDVGDIASGDFILFLDPVPGVEPTLTSPTIYKSAGGNPVASLGIMQIFARNTTVTVDEMRIGQSYLDVTPIPEPSSALLGALGVLAAVGIRRRK